ncbi:uncharacterized protein LOC135153244 [Lytechinus pictus]|uniref:uncharacterized protein LOC135153244 n=1 Tax=Lytechinus pictus TaxID=7653 RepID=UPI0030BA2506
MNVRSLILDLGISQHDTGRSVKRKKRTRRKRRGGKPRQNPSLTMLESVEDAEPKDTYIPVFITSRTSRASVFKSKHPPQHLRQIPQTISLQGNENSPTRIGLWNARSLMNKETEVCDFIISERIDVLAVTESWLRGDGRDSPTIAGIQNTLQDFKLLKLPRKGKRGGGLCVILRNSFSTKKKPHVFDTFECLEVTASSRKMSSQRSLSLFVIYRPPSCLRGQSFGHFLIEFSKLLESANLLLNQVVILGDFNIHVDSDTNADAKNFKDLLESAGLSQRISQPTHIKGHTLDLVIMRDNDHSIRDIVVTQTLPSDHSAIIFSLPFVRPSPTSNVIHARMLRELDIDQFKLDIIESFEAVTNLEEMEIDQKVHVFNDSLASNLDRHAPNKKRKVRVRPYAPWYNDAIRKAKQDLRASERRWRKTKRSSRTVVSDDMKEATREYYQLVNNFKRQHLQELISTSNSKQLFHVIDKMIAEKPDKSLPSHQSSAEIAQKFSKFFDSKIEQLRSSFSSSSVVVEGETCDRRQRKCLKEYIHK